MKVLVIGSLVCVGLIAIFFFWSSALDLPKLGIVEEPALSEVSGKELSIDGKPMLVTFFYTKCPDVCPFTMQDLKKVQQVLSERHISEDQYQILAVTLDPEHDTAENILQYKKGFDITSSNWLFLRGSEKETEKFAKLFQMVYEKNDDGSITHSITMHVVDSNRQIRVRHDMATGSKRVNIEKVADHIIQLIKE